MVDILQFRDAMGHFASGVTVVTVSDGAGSVGGLTANAFSSLSLEPPLVLICVDNLSKAREYLDREKAFTIHFLGHHQEDIAMAFAARGPDKANGIGWSLSARGIPVLDDYLVALECEMENSMQGGDHVIIVGRVLDIKTTDTDQPPLTYYKGQINALVPRDG
jgi:3-hydroxy-9,10-secoandrosta-1,3,5(10)-triene-9,17-dione monooxygenase reductase component